MKKLDFQKIWHSVKFPLIAILMGFIFGAIFIIVAGENPLVAYGALFSGSLGGVDKLGETMYKMTPILLTGLAVGIAFRTGLFNIGGEGQYIMGTLAAVSLGWVFRTLPGFLLIPILLIGGAGAGALWASIAGILKAKRGVHEVITTIMLNYIALFLANYLVRTILNSSVLEGTEKTAYSAAVPIQGHLLKFNEWIPAFQNSSAHTGILIAIGVAIGMWFLLFKTTIGYELRSVGKSPDAAEYGGISKTKNLILAMALSGALAGLAGTIQVMGLIYKVNMSSAMPGYGFDGIAVALVGQNHPIGIIFSALLFGILSNGARRMQLAGIPKEVIGIIQAIIILFIAAEQAGKLLEQWRKKRSTAKGESV